MGAFSEVEGEYLRITADEPVTTDRVGLVQPLGPEINRWITEVELRFDGGDPVRVDLTEASRERPGQVVEFGERTFRELEIEILADTIGFRPKLAGVSAVGFAEVDLADLRVEELIRPPVDVVEAAGDRLGEHRLTYVLQRQRTNPAEPVRVDEEPSMRRLLDVPDERQFELGGEARISAQAEDPVVDRLLGIPGAGQGGVTARSSEHLDGDLASRASASIDDDPETAWSTPFNDLGGQYVELELPDARSIDHVDLQVVTDDRHSVPTRLRISAGGEARELDLPPLDPGEDGAVTEVPLDFPALEGDTFRVTILEVRRSTTTDWYSGGAAVLPVALAELGLPGVRRGDPADEVTDRCFAELLAIDGEDVEVRLDGSTEDAEARLPLALEACNGPVALEGDTEVIARPGRDTGIDIDSLVLSSGPGGAAVPPGVTGTVAPGPELDVATPQRLEYEVSAEADEPFWLAVGESYSPEWATTVEGGSIAGHTVVSGFANGWLVEPDGDGPVTIGVSWPPQRLVWVALAISVIALIACLVVLVVDPRRRPGSGRDGAPAIVLRYPPRPEATLFAVRGAAVPVVGAGLAGFLLATPAVGVALAVAMAAALLWRWGAVVVRLAAPAVLLGVSLFVFAKQMDQNLPPDFAWPQNFDSAHWLTMAAILALGVDVVATLLRRRRAPDGDGS